MEYSCEIVLYHISYIDGNFVKLVVGAHYNRLSKFGVACCHNIPYNWKIWWGIKFGGLVVHLCDHQIKIHQYFILTNNIIHMVILIPNCQFKSANILQW